MPPRSFANPAPLTESAREARKAFFCELCQKGYSRMNEFDAHESSYDHQHKKRLKDMKIMQKDPNAAEKARRAERKADEQSGLITIKPLKLEGNGSKGGFKKGGFKSAFGASDSSTKVTEPKSAFKKISDTSDTSSKAVRLLDDDDSDDENIDYEYYDPRKPTGCDGTCEFVGGQSQALK